jgi:hypothetical protein
MAKSTESLASLGMPVIPRSGTTRDPGLDEPLS